MVELGTNAEVKGSGRRRFWLLPLLLCALIAAVLVGCGGDDDEPATGSDTGSETVSEEAPETTKIVYQLGWFVDEGMTGIVVAQEKGYFAEEGIELEIRPGGPNNDGIAPVASGQAQIGHASSSPALMLAVSQGIPIQAFGAQLQEHPYAYITMPDTPLETPQDLEGLNIGVPATGVELVEAMLAANDMSMDDLGGITNISFDVRPLLQGRIDVWGGWLTDVSQLELLPEGYHSLRLWDAGVPLYAAINYANPQWLEDNPELAEGFLRAAARGWADVRADVEGSVELMLEKYPDLESGAGSTVPELAEAVEILMEYMYTDASEADGWGAMDPDVWQSQIDLWTETDRFEEEPPTVDEVITMEPLEATVDDRLSYGG